jgi:voltage-gated potassium channel
VCLPDDGATLIASIALLHLAPGLTVAAQTDRERTRAALRDLGIGATVSVDSLVGHALAKSVESPHAGELLLRLVDTEHCRIIEYPVSPEDRGQSVDEVRQRAGSPLILGVVHEGAVRLGVSEPVHLADGDRLLVLAAAKPADGRD